MKRPSVKFDKEAVLGFLLNHCEKFIVGLIGLIGLGLVWSGANALRLKSVRSDQTPEAVSQLTAQTVQHIDAATKPPADALRKGGDLAAVIDPWRPQQVKVAPAPDMSLFDRPLIPRSCRSRISAPSRASQFFPIRPRCPVWATCQATTEPRRTAGRDVGSPRDGSRRRAWSRPPTRHSVSSVRPPIRQPRKCRAASQPTWW